jgi:hypothetical protein
MDPPFLAQLREDLVARLGVVEREAKSIRRALRALDERARSPAKTDPIEDILRELRTAPASRASLVALTLRRD